MNNKYEIIYRNRIIGYILYAPVIGDTIMGHIVWEVDYKHRIVYVTD